MLLAIHIRYVTLPLRNLYQSKPKLQKNTLVHNTTKRTERAEIYAPHTHCCSHSYWHQPRHIYIQNSLTYAHIHWPTFYLFVCLFVIYALLFTRCVFVCQNASEVVGAVVVLAKLLLSLLYMLLINFTMRQSMTVIPLRV